MGRMPQVGEEDLAVGSGGEPARGRPEEPAHSDDVGGLAEFLTRRVEQPELARTREEGDERRVVHDGDHRRLELPVALDDRYFPVGDAHRAGGGPCGRAGGLRRRGASRLPRGRAVRAVAEEVQANDLARRVPMDHEAAQRVHLQRDDRARKLGAPSHISGRVHHGQLALEGRGGDRAAGEVGDRVRDRAAQVVRPLVPPPLIEPLDSQRVATCQDHRGVTVDRQPSDVRHQAIVPEDLGLEPISATARTPGRRPPASRTPRPPPPSADRPRSRSAPSTPGSPAGRQAGHTD